MRSGFGTSSFSRARLAIAWAAATYIAGSMRRARVSIAGAQDAGEAEQVVHRAAVGGEGGAGGERVLGADLGVGVGEREDALAAPHLSSPGSGRRGR